MTRKVADQTTTASRANDPMGVRAVWLLILDTSMRLFVPSVGGTALGLWLDIKFDTKPLLTILGVTIGTLLAFSLVYLQIRAVNKEKKEPSD